MKQHKPFSLYLLGLAVIAGLLLYDRIFGLQAFFVEGILFIGLLSFVYYQYDTLRVEPWLFCFVILSFALHQMGTFGFYAASPMPFLIQWDHVTHFIPMMTFAMVFYAFVSQYFSKKKQAHQFLLIALCVLASLGVGSLVENAEFIGFNIWGFGEGGFAFGEGDAFPGQEVADQIESFVGGWFNAMWDLVVNLIGALVGVGVMVVRDRTQKNK